MAQDSLNTVRRTWWQVARTSLGPETMRKLALWLLHGEVAIPSAQRILQVKETRVRVKETHLLVKETHLLVKETHLRVEETSLTCV